MWIYISDKDDVISYCVGSISDKDLTINWSLLGWFMHHSYNQEGAICNDTAPWPLASW